MFQMLEQIMSKGFKGLFPAKVTTPRITQQKRDPFLALHFLVCNLVTAASTPQSVQKDGSFFFYKPIIKSIEVKWKELQMFKLSLP